MTTTPLRLLLKVSGEVFRSRESLFSPEPLHWLASEIQSLRAAGHTVAVVCGGGNLWRARDHAKQPLDRTVSDGLGMLATYYNACLLQPHLPGSRVWGVHALPSLAEPYQALRVRSSLAMGELALLAGGTGNPYCSTDTAAALRALELECDLLIKLTSADGVYDQDPNKYPHAVRYAHRTYDEVLQQHLQVMDMQAFALCRANSLPIRVLRFGVPGLSLRAAAGEDVGTLISHSASA
ncbi:UMP kinase [Candidatus Peribacteria bacterium]|nr:UMP kinase [Candidatus Peribacteria bacterium]